MDETLWTKEYGRKYESRRQDLYKHTETKESLLQGYYIKEGTECHGREGMS